MIFTGAKLDVGLYNDLLYRADNRVLPFPLKSLVDENIRGLIVEPLRPSPLEKLLELKPSALERVAVRQIMTVDEPADDDQVRVLARWNNPSRSPAVVERVLGDGRVLLWTTTADRAGNDWPIEPSFVLAVREAVRGAARPTRLDNTVTAGERMRRVVHSSQPISNVRLNSSRRRRARSLPATPLAEEPGDRGPAVEIDRPRHAPAGGVSHRLGRGAAGHAAGSLRGQPRPARERARADRGDRVEVAVRAAGRRDRRRRGPTAPSSSPRPAARSGATWRARCLFC